MIIGYTQGAYDMFHIGHLNLLRNAKAHCDYLIVGVNQDDLIRSYKNKSAIIPLEERMAIVAAIRYVDRVVSCDTLDKVDAWNKYHYDVLMIGDDWKGSPRWEETERQINALGAKLLYLPYTHDTSSTILREKLQEY